MVKFNEKVTHFIKKALTYEPVIKKSFMLAHLIQCKLED